MAKKVTKKTQKKVAAPKERTIKKPKAAAKKAVMKTTKKPQNKEKVKKATQAKKKIVKKAPAKKIVTTPSSSSESEPLIKPAAKPVATRPVVPKMYGGYTEAQYLEYQKHVEELRELSNPQLQQMCKINNQSKSGTKGELVVKVADGRVLGQIPRCPHCFGGRPRYNQATGTYKCPGYRDDTDFKWCNKNFTLEELPRLPWVQ